MKHVLLIFCLGVAFVCHGQTYKVADIPAELLEGDPDKVIISRTKDVVVENRRKVIERINLVYTIFEEEDKYHHVEYGDFVKVKHIEARIFDKNGVEVKKVKSKEILDYAYSPEISDSRYKLIPTSYGKLPYTVELSYEIIHDGIMFYPDFEIQWPGVAVKFASYKITMPLGFDIQYKAINTDIEPTESSIAKQKMLYWEAENLSKLSPEPFAGGASEHNRMVLISPIQFSLDGYNGSMENWDAFGRFMYKLNEGSQNLSQPMKEEIQHLVQEGDSNLTKIEKLYHYLQENFRYVSIQLGIGGWKAFDAEYVFENKYGDCKALSNFMMTMLSEVGIEAQPALVRSQNSESLLFDDFVKPIFDHEILYIPSEGMFLECTSSCKPTGNLAGSVQGKKAFVFNQGGGFFKEVPKLSPEQNTEMITAEMMVDLNGKAEIKIQEKRTGVRQDSYRYQLANSSMEHFRKEFIDDLNINGAELNNLEAKMDKSEPELLLEYDLVSKRYTKKAGKRIFVPLNGIDRIRYKFKSDEERVNDIINRIGFTKVVDITLDLGEHLQLPGFTPYSFTLDSDFGAYMAESTLENNKLHYKRVFTLKEFEIDKSRYSEMLTFFNAIMKEEKKKVALEKLDTMNRP